MLVPKTYDVLYRCIEDGIAMGFTRAYKHDSRPDHDAVKESIHREIMNEISEWFDIKHVTVGVIDE